MATASGLPGHAGWADGAGPVDDTTTVEFSHDVSAGWSPLQMLMLVGVVVSVAAVVVQMRRQGNRDDVGHQKCLA